MKFMYDYPIIGGIALGLKTVIDTVKYIIKKPILLGFSLIRSYMLFGCILLYALITMLISLTDVRSITPNFIIGETVFLGLTVYAISLYLYYWVASATSSYIEQNIIQKNDLPFKKIAASEDNKANIHIKATIFALIMAFLFIGSLIKLNPDLPKRFIILDLKYIEIGLFIFSFYFGPLIAYKSPSLANLIKENLLLLLSNPFATATISLVIFGINEMMNQIFFNHITALLLMYGLSGLPILLITKLLPASFILPIAQSILYLRIHKKFNGNKI